MAGEERFVFVTANVGSLFNPRSGLQEGWLSQFLQELRRLRPSFLALHMQEVGGKEWEEGIPAVESFLRRLQSEAAAAVGLSRGRAYLDHGSTAPGEFTALGSLYLANDAASTSLYHFDAQEFQPLEGFQVVEDSRNEPTILRRRFPPSEFPEFCTSRKGFTRTRWRRAGRSFDLVNLHLFHNASNLAALAKPGEYPRARERGLRHVLSTLPSQTQPTFFFGDFNFRLEPTEFVARLAAETEKRISIQGEEGGEEAGTIEYFRNSSQECVLRLGAKIFQHCEGGARLAARWREYREDDGERAAFPELWEAELAFPPSYPWSERLAESEKLMDTRPPAWCDRVLANAAAEAQLLLGSPASQVAYAPIGAETCMGDHKPVLLAFSPPLHPPTNSVQSVARAAIHAPLSLAEYSREDRDLLSWFLSYSDRKGLARKEKLQPSLPSLTVATADFVTKITLREDLSALVEDGSRFYGRESSVVAFPASSESLAYAGTSASPAELFARQTPSQRIFSSYYGRQRPLSLASSTVTPMRSNKRLQTDPTLTLDDNSLRAELAKATSASPASRRSLLYPHFIILRQDVSVSLRTLALIKAKDRNPLI